jgi:penicillin-binding protein-related factor A (putative recombinase)
MIAACECGAIVWRNNVGMLMDKRGVPVKYGLCVGSSDLIGIYKGAFLALEIKQPGKKPTTEQVNFLRVVKENGGIAAVVFSADDVKKLLTGF